MVASSPWSSPTSGITHLANVLCWCKLSWLWRMPLPTRERPHLVVAAVLFGTGAPSIKEQGLVFICHYDRCPRCLILMPVA